MTAVRQTAAVLALIGARVCSRCGAPEAESPFYPWAKGRRCAECERARIRECKRVNAAAYALQRQRRKEVRSEFA